MFALGTSLTIRPIYIYFQGQILDLKLIGSATSNPHRHEFFFCTGDAAVVLMPACLPACHFGVISYSPYSSALGMTGSLPI